MSEEDFDELEIENDMEDEQMFDTISRPKKQLIGASRKMI